MKQLVLAILLLTPSLPAVAQADGIIVEEVVAESGAEQAGLLAGDRITVAQEALANVARHSGAAKAVLSKLHLADRTQAAVWAWRRGHLSEDP